MNLLRRIVFSAAAVVLAVGLVACGQSINRNAPDHLTATDSAMARALAAETCQCTAKAMLPDATADQITAAEACIKNVKAKAKEHMKGLRDESIRKSFNDYGQRFVDTCYVQQRTAAGLPALPDYYNQQAE